MGFFPPHSLPTSPAPTERCSLSYERGMTKAPSLPSHAQIPDTSWGMEPFRVACELNMTLLKCLPERLPQSHPLCVSEPLFFPSSLSAVFCFWGIRFIWAVGVLNDR